MSNGNGWKIVGCLCALGGVLAVGSYAKNSINHCSDEKTERARIDFERTKYICDSDDRRAQIEYDRDRLKYENS